MDWPKEKLFVASLALLTSALAGACSSSSTVSDGGDGASDAGTGAPTTVVLHPDAPPLPGESICEVVRTTGLTQQSTHHVDVCQHVEYSTNPPSSGDHWGVWATYAEHASPVPREVYVHNLEHGAVVLAYRCDGECDDVKDALRRVLDRVATDPLCASQPVARARVLITPDPELPTPIAAAAWRATYVATCIDEASLEAFVADAYGRGTEATCAGGAIGDPATIDCSDAGAGGAGGSGGGRGGSGGGAGGG